MTLLCVYRLCFDHCACVYLMVCISRRAFVPFSHCHAWPWVPDCPLLEELFGGSFVSYQTTKFVFFSWKNEKLLPYVALIAGPRELRGATVCDSVSKCRLSLPGTWWCIEPTCTCTVEFVQLGWRKKKKGYAFSFTLVVVSKQSRATKTRIPIHSWPWALSSDGLYGTRHWESFQHWRHLRKDTYWTSPPAPHLGLFIDAYIRVSPLTRHKGQAFDIQSAACFGATCDNISVIPIE